MMKKMLMACAGLCLCALMPAGAEPAKTVPLAERVTIATQLYNGIATYYAHWQGAPGFDLDRDYQTYLGQILTSDDRRNFSLASLAFIAKLNNGHSNFYDQYLDDAYGTSFGVYAMPLHDKWTVIISRVAALKPGDVIGEIDGEDFEEFYRANRQYVPGSSEAARKTHFFYERFLFPQSFTFGMADGRKIAMKRIGPPPAGADPDAATKVREEGDVLYLRVPGFDDPAFEADALKAVEAHLDARAVIVDVRGNGGGSTPGDLVSTLMDRPFEGWSEKTPVTLGVIEVHQEVGPRPFLRWDSAIEQPARTHYAGQVLILTDARCFSACEDFVEPFKVNHRATIIGTRTGGSTGQPYSKDLGDGFSFRVSTKREMFPDGSEFEGVGIAPDIAVEPTPDDLKAGRDPVLAKAHALIK
ncbi:MAG: S41 family peptidase [Rhizomicrobium sp.]|jgi:carboxyl-terminal processing protease